MIIKRDNAYYLIYYIDRFGKDGSIDIAGDLLAKIDRNDTFLDEKTIKDINKLKNILHQHNG